MKNRTIVIVLMGYIIGIIVGLYFKISIVLFYGLLLIFYLTIKLMRKNKKAESKVKIKKLNIFSFKRYFRYVRIHFSKIMIIILIISSIISNSIILFKNKNYKSLYQKFSSKEELNIIAKIISNKEKREYSNKYLIKAKYNGNNVRLYLYTKEDLKYGDIISVIGKYEKPEVKRNYKGFNYQEYLKQLKIFGSIKSENISIKEKGKINDLFSLSNLVNLKIKENVKKVLDEGYSSIILGLVLGDTKGIDEDTKENFKNASMLHILAVSGMHISYLILGINLLFKKTLGKNLSNIMSIIFLICYMFITNFSISVTRAGIMGILMIFSKILHRKNDIITSLSISLLIILIYNPYLINNLGTKLTYLGTLGIVLENKFVLSVIKSIKIKNEKYKYFIRPKIQKYIDKIKEILSISISVQLYIFPILIYEYNIFTPYSLITNLFLSFLIGPIVIICFIFIVINTISYNCGKVFSKLIKILIQILIYISKIGKIPFSRIYFKTPSIISILIYFIVFFVIKFIYNLYSKKYINQTDRRLKNLLALVKIMIREQKNNKKINNLIKVFSIIFIIIIISINIIPKKLKIYFVDVGQGDSTFIVTPRNETILIDGGGSEFSDYDVGKNVLLPYVLDRGYTSIDYVIISHFDSDHVKGILTLMKEIKLKNIFISKQKEKNKNIEEFLKIVKEKNIKVSIVNRGQRINIEKNLYIDVLWPDENNINDINNDAIVCKLNYKNFSILFTGDIEKEAEKKIINLYKNKSYLLKTDILKVPHHGSRTSSTEEFLNLVKPQVALIGVQKKNKYGHPNKEVLERLKKINCKIYRTDLNGEIEIKTNGNKINIKKFIKDN